MWFLIFGKSLTSLVVDRLGRIYKLRKKLQHPQAIYSSTSVSKRKRLSRMAWILINGFTFPIKKNAANIRKNLIKNKKLSVFFYSKGCTSVMNIIRYGCCESLHNIGVMPITS